MKENQTEVKYNIALNVTSSKLCDGQVNIGAPTIPSNT